MTFNVGDIVEITGPERMPDWVGMRARVLPNGVRPDEDTYLRAVQVDSRPDGVNRNIPFYWRTDQLRLVEAREDKP